ncbi:winged helix-turn-helix transcriptional regulator [Candidatus Gottesmanbacteria bacterium]|nr:winged helix-turn-helix transcriptional regulator [Candidatus Gottesmanbacteria bacterium]
MKKHEVYKTIQQAFDLLGNPLRFTIFLKIAEQGCDCDLDSQKGYSGNCVSGVMKDLHIPQSTASSYIKDLENWGLIECRKNGKFLYCKPKRETLIVMKSFINGVLSGTRR